jgi:carboxyl-terminal processing protease
MNLRKAGSVRSALLAGFGIGLGASIIFILGFILRDIAGPLIPQANALVAVDYHLLNEVQGLVDRHYLRQQPDLTQRQYAAIRGVLATLEDRYTFFIEPPVAQSESDVLAGVYGGIGLQVTKDEQGRFVLFPFEDSPALEKGIESGDLLEAINGSPVDLTMRQDSIDQMLRGEVKPGNGVELSVIKPDGRKLTVYIEFSVITVPSIVWRPISEIDGVGYIQIIRFTSRTPDEMFEALRNLAVSDLRALIIDLRNNSGGLLQESIDVTSLFLNSDQIVVYEVNNHSERALKGSRGHDFADIPLVVLVNQGTASAAELMAGAIKDYGRGILIGQRTFGKGTVQQIFRLSDNSSVHITSAEWLTPNRQKLEGIGLEPDIAMIPDENSRDVELGEAIRYLTQRYGAN